MPKSFRRLTWVRAGNRYPDVKGEGDHFLDAAAVPRAAAGRLFPGRVSGRSAGLDAQIIQKAQRGLKTMSIRGWVVTTSVILGVLFWVVVTYIVWFA